MTKLYESWRFSTKYLIFLICINFGLMNFSDCQILGPISTSVLINNTVRLRCRIHFSSNYNRIKVQWLKDGFGYENETLRDHFNGRYQMPGSRKTGTYDLVIHSVNKQDDGEYACQVNAAIHDDPESNILKTTTSINLTVIVPPDKVTLKFSHLEGPNSSNNYGKIQTVWGKINEFLSFSCEVQHSRPAAHLIWMLGNFELREGHSGDIEGLEIGSVITKSEVIDNTEQFLYRSESKLRLRLRKEHSGEILKCQISNAKSFLNKIPKSENVVINVLYVINVKVDVFPRHSFFQFSEHDIVQINCSATSNPTKVIYNWIRYDPQTSKMKIIKFSDPYGILKIKINRDLNSMLIRCQVLSSITGYECISNFLPDTEISENIFLQNCSENHIVSSSSQIPLRVHYSPIIVDPVLETRSAFFGDIVTLECKVDSNPPAKITWYKSKYSAKEIMANPDLIETQKISRDNTVPSYSSMTLLSMSEKYQFTVTDVEKFGLFVCQARTDSFSPVQKIVFVGQGASPQIINNQKLISAEIGLPAKIPCNILSIPLPEKGNILWFKNPMSLPIKQNSKNKIYEDLRLAGIISYLYFDQVTHDDYGEYNCSVTNLYGHISSTIELVSPAEFPTIFVIGSSCAVVLVLIFGFGIFCIIKTSRTRSSSVIHRPAYIKGEIIEPSQSPINQKNFGSEFQNSYINDVEESQNLDFRNTSPKASKINLESQSILNNISGYYLDSQNNCYQAYTKDVNTISEPQTLNIYQRRSEWLEGQISQAEGANESMRSYDSGVCPDESILTSCSPYHFNQSTNCGLTPCHIIPFSSTPKFDMDIKYESNSLYNVGNFTFSNNLLSPVSLTSTLFSKPFINYTNRNNRLYNNPSTKESIVLPNINLENSKKKILVSNNLSNDAKNESDVPYIIAYSPTLINRKVPEWSSLNQNTKL